MKRLGPIVLAVAVLVPLAVRGATDLIRRTPEDFIYYYTGTSLYWQGHDPYNSSEYQGRLESILNSPNPYPSRTSAFLYPPIMAWVFGPFTAMSIPNAYQWWSILLAILVIAAWSLMTRNVNWDQSLAFFALFLACPGVENAIFTHKAVWLTFTAFLAGLWLLDQGFHIAAGGCFGLMSIQPQWALVIFGCLSLGRKWKSLVTAVLVSGLAFVPYVIGLRHWAELRDYVSTVWNLQNQWVFSGNLSLAAGVSRILNPSIAGALYSTSGSELHILWMITVALFLAAMIWTWKGLGNWRDRTLWTVALALWIQPYSHGSELIWVMPWILSRLQQLYRGNSALRIATYAALGVTIFLRMALDFPAGHGHIASAYFQVAFAALLFQEKHPRNAWIELPSQSSMSPRF